MTLVVESKVEDVSAQVDQFSRELVTATRPPSVVALVPAHNEEKLIAQTIHSLFKQTFPLTSVLVIADNCTDRTVAIVQELKMIYSTLEVMESVDNRAKKAGALNQGFERTTHGKFDFVLQMDADTVLHEKLVEEALREFTDDPQLGGICSRFGVKRLTEKVPRFQALLWKLQNIEYGLSDAYRVETLGKVKVISGTVSVYRTQILEQLLTQNGYVWDEASRVEDYVLTLDVKKARWKASVGMEMKSWTDVPLTVKELINQRIRWYGGSADTSQQRGVFSKEMRSETAMVALTVFLYLCRFIFVGALLYVILIPGLHPGQLPLYSLALPLMAWSYHVYRLKYVEDMDGWQYALSLTYIPMELYSMFRESILLYSYVDSFVRKNHGW